VHAQETDVGAEKRERIEELDPEELHAPPKGPKKAVHTKRHKTASGS